MQISRSIAYSQIPNPKIKAAKAEGPKGSRSVLFISSRSSKKPSAAPPDLAQVSEIETADEGLERNRQAVLQLYEALEARDVERVQKLLVPDLEWWFHGPRSHQHMKRLLTGEEESFQFAIHSVEAFGTTVLAEGTDHAGSVFWVHAWTVTDGMITEVREYFNTTVTVTRVVAAAGKSSSGAASHCFPVWQSRLPGSAGKSLPGLVLAI